MNDVKIEESTIESVPVLLEEIIKFLLARESSQDVLNKDLFVALLVALMIENGFTSTNSEHEETAACASAYTLPFESLLSNWRDQSGCYNIKFVFNGFSDMHLKIIVTPVGATMLINGVLTDFRHEVYSICLPVSRYVVSPNASSIPMKFRDLRHLSNVFKNKVVNPLRCRVLHHYGYPNACLIGLPEEVLFKIFTLLPLASVLILTETCQRLKRLGNEDRLWHALCKRDSKVKEETDVGDWRDAYKNCYLKEKKARPRSGVSNRAGSLHDDIDYSDYISHVNPLWDNLIM